MKVTIGSTAVRAWGNETLVKVDDDGTIYNFCVVTGEKETTEEVITKKAEELVLFYKNRPVDEIPVKTVDEAKQIVAENIAYLVEVGVLTVADKESVETIIAKDDTASEEEIGTK